MGNKLRAVLKQTSMVGGVPQAVPPLLEVERPGGFLHGHRQKGSLYVLVEPQHVGLRDAVSLLREVIGRAYFGDPSLSITSCLLRSVQAAHIRLRAENEAAPLHMRTLVALTCLVLKGSDLYIAQAGPGLVYVLDRHQLTVLRGQQAGSPLGGHDNPEPLLSHQRLPDGGTIALFSSSLHPLPEERVRAALANEAQRALQELSDMAAQEMGIANHSIAVLELTGRSYREPAPIRRLATPEAGRPGQTKPTLRSRRPPRFRFSDLEEALDPNSAQVGDRVVAFLESAGGSLRRYPYAAPVTPASRVWCWALAVLLVLLALWGVRYWQARTLEASASDALVHAEQLEREARETHNLALRRRLLAEAEQLVLQASEVRTADRQARTLKLRIQTQLDELNTVSRLRRSVQLADISETDSKADPSQLVVEADSLFVLDRSGDRVYRYPLDPDQHQVHPQVDDVLLRRGDDLGGGLAVGELVTMTWMPSGGARQRSTLLVLDERGFLIEYDPSRGLTAMPVYGMGGWGQIRAIAGYAGNLYVLDVGQRNLLWHPPSPSGYVRMAYNYFHPEVVVDVTSASDLAVEDNLYLLYANGRVERYFAGRSQPFPAMLPDSPIREGTALCIGAISKSVYVADRPNERIVQFSREGEFVRQIRYSALPNAFADLRDLAVDESNGRLYVLSGQQVYLLELPPTPTAR